MKILDTDNFGGDFPAERFIENLPPLRRETLVAICVLINRDLGEGASRFYSVVEDDYVLQPGFEA